MMKKIIAVFCLVFVAVTAFCSCNNKNVNATEETETTADISATTEYIYEQELNIIDDNYRNYYEVFVYSYCDSNGDGIGDINGLISKLDYIKDSGFNGIWLMPVMQSPTYHKYDVVDYYSIDSQYGTTDDFRRLVDECHNRDINLIIDLVINHTSSQHEWFKNAKKEIYDNVPAENRKYYNYYNFVEEKDCNKSGYRKLGFGDYYYEGVFTDRMPDLNLDNPEVREEIQKIVDYWLGMGVDGFRLDAAKEYYSGNINANIEVLDWFNTYCKSVLPDCYLVAEVWDTFTNYTQYYKSGIDSVFDYTLADTGGRVAKILRSKGSLNSAQAYCENLKTIDETIHSVNAAAIDAPFINNHDIGRVSGYFNDNERLMKASAGMNIMTSGAVFVYYGEEIGMAGSGKDQNKRAPMIWSDTDKTGMTNGPSEMEKQQSVFPALDIQISDNNSLYNYYKRALRIRNENPEIARGKVTEIVKLSDEELCGVRKNYEGSDIIIVYNLSDTEKNVNISETSISSAQIRGYLTSDISETVTLENNVLTLPQYSIVILK